MFLSISVKASAVIRKYSYNEPKYCHWNAAIGIRQNQQIIEPHHEKPWIQDLRPGPTQTRLYNHFR